MHESAKNADTEIIGYRHLYSDKYERVPSELVVYLTKHRIPTTVVVKQCRTAPKKSV